MMVCTLYFFHGGRQKFTDISRVEEFSKKIRLVFTDGSNLEVIRQHLLHFESYENEAIANEAHAQDVFNSFDTFVSNFISQVEQMVDNRPGYCIAVNELNSFKKLLGTCCKPHLKEVISIKP